MRRIMMFNRVSADGYFAAADGSLDWVVQDEDLDKESAKAIGRADTDTILFGRRTYEQFESFWPHALDDSPTSPDPHQARRRSKALRAMAVMLNEATKLVFSRTRNEVTWKNSRLIHEFDAQEIAEMKRQPGKHMIIFGSGTIVSLLSEHRLIDEYQFVVCPVLLGAGRALLSGLSKRLELELQEAKKYPSGNVVLRYACC
jgi:dihydrofolate reductase